MVVDVVEEPFDVSFNEPVCTSEEISDGTQGCLTASSWSESMRSILEMSFVNSFKNKSDDLLYHLIFD